MGNKNDPIVRLYQAHAANVLGLLVRLTGGNRAEAEDLLQDTFVAAFQGQERYAGRGSERAWLMGIAVRRWRDKIRRRQVKTAAFPEEEEAVLASGASSVEQQVTARIILDTALERLDPRNREVLLLVTGQGLSHKEVAAIMEEPVGTIKWRLHEATKSVRQYLTALGWEGKENESTLGSVLGHADNKA